MIKILIVDDSALIRKYMIRLIELEPDLQVCGEAYDEKSGLKAVQGYQPDIVIVDISFGGNEAGIDLMKAINTLNKNLPMLALSLHEETIYGERVRQAGAQGYLMKQESADHLIPALRQIMSGKRYVYGEVLS